MRDEADAPVAAVVTTFLREWQGYHLCAGCLAQELGRQAMFYQSAAKDARDVLVDCVTHVSAGTLR